MALIKKSIDWKYIIYTILLLVIFVMSYAYNTILMSTIRNIFETPNLNLYFGAFAFVINLLHKIKMRSLKISPSMSFTEFLKPVKDIFSYLIGTVTIVAAITLAKGIVLQLINGNENFPFLGNGIELSFIGLIVAYLLYQSLMELYIQCKDIFLRDLSNSDFTPLPEIDKDSNT